MKRTRKLSVCLALAAALLCAAACSSDPLENSDDRSYNVLLITIDTLRADRLGAYGYERAATPRIDALAADGVRFARAYTTVPATLPAHASILTGAYPPHHGVRSNGIFRVRDSTRTLAEALKTRDYRTGAVVGAVVLDSAYGLDQGFDLYDDEIEGPVDNLDLMQAERNAEQITERALEFLDGGGDGPFFLWAHYFDPHTVYDPPPRFAERFPQSPYDGEVAYVDEQVGLLLDRLRELELGDDTLVILTADHGEGLGDHGEGIHGVLLYDSTLHVPLVVSNPHLLEPSVVDTPVSVVDIVPTILDLMNIDPTDEVHGESLIPFVTGETTERGEAIYFETLLPFFDYGWAGLRGVRREDMKYISGPTPRLYDTGVDPGELDNLYSDTHDAYRRLQFALNELAAAIEWDGSAEEAAMDAERRAQLASLGYVSGATHTSLEGDPFSGPDPESRVWVVDALNNASYAFLQGRHGEALAELDRIHAEEPGNPSVLSLLGHLNNSIGRLDLAEGYLLELVESQPDREHHWSNLGVNYRLQRRTDDAETAFGRALEINPQFTDALYFLALIALERGDPVKAAAGLEQVIEAEPDHTGALNRLGESLARAGRYSDAIPHLERAVSIDPSLGPAHQNLAVCYVGLKDVDKAAHHFLEARRLGIELDPRMTAWLDERERRR